MSTIKVDCVETTDDTKHMQFSINSTEAMRIDTDGRLLVGTTSPFSDNFSMSIAAPSSKGCIVYKAPDEKNHSAAGFLNSSGTLVGKIVITQDSTLYQTSSDYRLKTDAQPMTGASARVQALNPVNFEWIANGSRTDGFLAHEAQAVVPECASGTKDAVGKDGKPEYQGIDQSKLVPLLTAALQEALTRIEALESKA